MPFTKKNKGRSRLTFPGTNHANVSPHDLGNGQLQLDTQGLPLAALLPVYRRSNLDLSTHGDLTGNVNCQWSRGASGPELLADGAFTVADAVVEMPSVLGQDTLQSRRAFVALDGAIQNEELHIHKLDSESDYGQLRIRGHIPLAELFASDLH